MDKIVKALQKLNAKEKEKLQEILFLIKQGDLQGLDIKKLTGRDDIYRVRKGDIRVIFRKIKNEIKVLAVERRTDTTYHS